MSDRVPAPAAHFPDDSSEVDHYHYEATAPESHQQHHPNTASRRFHHFTPDVARQRPSTASKSRFVGQYRQLNRLLSTKEQPPFRDDTTKTMEFLVCTQQLDNTLMKRQTEDPQVRKLEAPKKEKSRCGSAGVRVVFEPNRPGLKLSAEKPLANRREEKTILDRRTEATESHLVRKLALMMRGEERRTQADETRALRPILEAANRRATLWAKMICVTIPALVFTEELRQHQARRTLNNLFLVQIKRFLKRRKERFVRQRLFDERLSHMRRPSASQLAHAIPVLKHIPEETLDAIIAEMEPHCFRTKEYMSFSRPAPKRGGMAGGVSAPAKHVDKPSTSNAAAGTATPSHESEDDDELPGGQANETAEAPLSIGEPDPPAKKVRSSTAPGVFFIESGIVDVFYTNISNVTGQRRKKKIVERVVAGSAVGVEAILMTQARKHIAVCKSDVNAWELNVDSLFAAIQSCPENVKRVFHGIAEDRRREMLRLQPLTESAVRASSAFFREWRPEGIQSILRVVSPLVLHKGQDVPRGVVFVVHGRLEIAIQPLKPTGVVTSELIKSGRSYGELECFVIEESRRRKAVAAATSDVWLLRKADLLCFAAHENISSLLPLMAAMGKTGNLPGGGDGTSAFRR